MTKRQASPGVQQAKNFPDYIQGIRGIAPPIPRVERILCRCVHDNAAFAVSKRSPQGVHAACVRLAGYNDHGVQGCGVQGEFDGDDFIGGVENGRLEYMNGSGRHAFVNENFAAVIFFAEIFQPHVLQRFAGFRGMCEPDFRSVASAIKFGCFQDAKGHAAAEDGDGLSVV